MPVRLFAILNVSPNIIKSFQCRKTIFHLLSVALEHDDIMGSGHLIVTDTLIGG
jgi:hypothetical protein